jgi:hypothetical protein
MQLLCRLLCILTLLVPLAAQAGDVKLKVSIRAHGWWWPFEPRYAPPVSPHHLSAATKPATDSCTFVAGVRHCPLLKPGAEPR